MVLTLAMALTLVNVFYLLNLKPDKRRRFSKKSVAEQLKQGLHHTTGILTPT